MIRTVIVPCLQDNYAYLVHAEGSSRAVVIDASEAEPVLAALQREGLEACAIVATHHHWDHVGGHEGLLAALGALPVHAHESDRGRVAGQTVDVRDGQPFELAGLSFAPLHVPGHTSGAVSYVVGDAVFTGDTLFCAGCGRLFEGTAAQMHTSLSRLGALPGTLRVHPGHEYTVANLRFARAIEPDNAAVEARLADAAATRERGEPTVPSTVALELATNPFLRAQLPSVRAGAVRLGQELAPDASAAEAFAAVRRAKDVFRG